MKKDDIERSYHNSTRGLPMVNVKWHTGWFIIKRKFKGVTAVNKKGETYDVHEYGDAEPEFWEWADEQDDLDWSESHAFETADRIAREVGWEDAQSMAEEIFDRWNVKVWSAGRSGGWLVVDGLPDIDEWDAIMVSRWSRFAKNVQALVDDLDYQFLWHLYVNVWESQVAEPLERAEETLAAWINVGLVPA